MIDKAKLRTLAEAVIAKKCDCLRTGGTHLTSCARDAALDAYMELMGSDVWDTAPTVLALLDELAGRS
jgi:hypothetical protein